MSKSNAWEEGLLKLTFNNTAFANVGDTSGLQPAGAAGNLHVSLHTADPGEAGTQATNEGTYTGYARKAVARSTAGWTVTAGAVANTAAITFVVCTTGSASNTVTYFGVGTDSSGAGVLLYSGALTASLAVSGGITPAFAIGALDVTEG